jgi:hypothetical protein
MALHADAEGSMTGQGGSPETDHASPEPAPRGGRGPQRPLYKGAPLDADRGPGLGCFWTQAVILAILVVLVPVGVWNGWPIEITEGLLVVTLILVFFVSLTLVFLLRLVAADRRARRAPLRSGARQTVGQLEDAARAAASDAPAASAPHPASGSAPSESGLSTPAGAPAGDADPGAGDPPATA